MEEVEYGSAVGSEDPGALDRSARSMTTARFDADEPAERLLVDGVPIAEVSRALRVPMPTLRSWELRYQIPAASRLPGKHRRYSAQEVHTLRLMRDEISRGTRASIAAQLVRTLLGIQGPAGDLIKIVLAAAAKCDAEGVRAGLNQAEEVLGLAGCIDEVLLPALRQVGQWWATGVCDLSQEHLATEAARAWLDKRSAYTPPPTMRRPVVLACGPGDLHTVGLEALALLLRQQGWPCRLLGAHTSISALTTAILATGAAGVVLVSHLPTGRRRAVDAMTAASDLGLPVFYAGNAFSSARRREQLPGRYLGIRLREACDMVDTALRTAAN